VLGAHCAANAHADRTAFDDDLELVVTRLDSPLARRLYDHGQ
jgi:hypothetical protein